MKIFANIPGALKLVNCLKYLEVNKKAIEDAKASGDFDVNIFLSQHLIGGLWF